MTKPTKKKTELALVGDAQAPVINEIERPCFAVYEVHTSVAEKNYFPGVWYHDIRVSGKDERSIPVDRWICAPLIVEAETVNTEDRSIGRLLSFYYRGQRVEWVMPMDALAGKGDDVLKALMRQGLTIDYQQRRFVAPYIASHHAPTRVLATTTKPGWHESGAFVLPQKAIGGENVRYQSSGNAVNLFTSKGTIDGWKKEIGKYCVGNPVLVMSVCCALAGPLLAKIGVNGGGVHLVGDSSSGKSLAQLIAASVWGNPSHFAASWDVSKGGVEIEAASRNDTILILDEIKRADPKRVQEMAYAIANGMGKGTMTREREGRAKLMWRVLALSSGERSLSEHAAISGNSAHAGAELRLVDINAGTRKFRAFDDVHDMSGQEFHRVLSDAVTRHYGHVGVRFVESLLAIQDKENLHEEFSKVKSLFHANSSQAGRVSDRFSIMAFAGELAIRLKIIDWKKGTAITACQQLFGEWMAKMGDGNAEDRQILRSIEAFIELHGDSRFSDIHPVYDSATSIRDRAGFFEKEGGDKRLFLFTRTSLEEAAPGFGCERVVRALVTADALAKTDSDKTQKRFTKKYRRPGGGSLNAYVIDPEKLIS